MASITPSRASSVLGKRPFSNTIAKTPTPIAVPKTFLNKKLKTLEDQIQQEDASTQEVAKISNSNIVGGSATSATNKALNIAQVQNFPLPHSTPSETGAPSGAMSGVSVGGVNPATGPSQGSNFPGQGRGTDKRHSIKEYRDGVIFSAPFHEHDFNQKIGNQSAKQSTTRIGTVYSKYRKFIVIARFRTHVLALPIYTHEGRGLANKQHRDEFVSIRDSDLKGTAAGPESRHDIVWAVRYSGFNSRSSWNMMSDTTSIHFTKVYAHNPDTKSTISGQLEHTSLVYLQKLFTDAFADATRIYRGQGQLSSGQPPSGQPSSAHQSGDVRRTGQSLFENIRNLRHPLGAPSGPRSMRAASNTSKGGQSRVNQPRNAG